MFLKNHQKCISKLTLILIIFVLPVILCSLPFQSYCQSTAPNYKVNLIPPSPEAAALAKYADVPVSLYSGIPEISVPLYEVKERSLSLPIILSYHASGNKIDAIAPRTGLGWSLQAHGSISRSMRSRPDEYGQRGFLYQSQQRLYTDYQNEANNNVRWQWFADMADGCIDLEPDQFYFNFGTYSGTFTFDNWLLPSQTPDFNRVPKVIMDSGSKIKIEPIGLSVGALQFINKWQATAEDGTVFILDVIETSTIINYGGSDPSCADSFRQWIMPNTWYLSEVRSPNGESWIRFEYGSYRSEIFSLASQSQTHNIDLAPAEVKSDITKTVSYVKQLRTITTSSGQTTINFVDGNLRADLNDTGESVNTGGYTLGQLIVRNNRGRTIKDWRFGYDYSIGRLTLRTLTEWAETLSNPPYHFSYKGSIGQRKILAYNQDHWGFLNNNIFQSLIPSVWATKFLSPNPIFLEGANREPSLTGALQGLLAEITYPTGGKDILTFEPHDYSFKNGGEIREQATTPRSVERYAPHADTPAGNTIVETVDFNVLLGTEYLDIKGNFSYGMLSTPTSSQYATSIKVTNLTTGEVLYNQSPGGVASGEEGNIIPTIIDSDARFVAPIAGLYRLEVKGRKTTVALQNRGQNQVFGTVEYNDPGSFFTPIKIGGGVRIASITRSSGNGNPDKVTKYLYRVTEDGVEKSSGSLAESDYVYSSITHYEEVDGLNGTTKRRDQFSRSSQNRATLGATKGSHVGYSTVIALEGENGKYGKTIHTFTSAREFADGRFLEIPYPPTESYDYARGASKAQFIYDQSGSLVKKIENQYAFNQQNVLAIKMGWFSPGGLLGPEYMDAFAPGYYPNILGYARLIGTIETTFFPDKPGTVPFTMKKKFTFDEAGHKQLSLVRTNDSDKDSTFTQLIYPSDIVSPPVGSAIDLMQKRNVQNQVLESVSWRQRSGNERLLLSGTSTNFITNNTKVVPSSMLSAKISAPVSTTDPLATARQLYEGRLTYSAYDFNFINVLQHSMPNGVNTAYLWGENGTVVIAKADHAQSKQIYHTSFEEDALANTQYQKTGRGSKAINGTYVIPTANRPAFIGTYLLSWWEKIGTAGWAYKEKSISYTVIGAAIATDAVNGYIDEVRLYPVGAKMTTFAHEPLVGITSITDANNVSVYFEYDEFNRLKLKRDQDGNIIEWFDYKLQEPVSAIR